ncbi:Uma2 family endonuclease [Flectobacillus major]|uniref:Uma2 family endonuclease n=1 Tax=Flectobacillus major TaxID=103 RepID=UPI000427A097|nr:Uma2 family endonuclease [Flectobacillus major]
MELLAENIAETLLSDYEIERNKPMPTLLHGAIQANLIFEIKFNYRDKFRVASEVSLATPNSFTPDVVLYPFENLDFQNDPSRRQDAPLLSIEIQSASQSSKDMTSKLEPYFNFGIKSCWIVVPDFQGVFVYDSPNHYEFFHEDQIVQDRVMNIEIPISKIFA